MSVRHNQTNEGGCIYFITFTCYRWLPLFEQTNAYDAVYKWFDFLTGKGGGIIGYVIMPNHLHALTYLPSIFKTPNIVVGNAKRFLSYEIVKRLDAAGADLLLQQLHGAVKKREAKARYTGYLKKALTASLAIHQTLLRRSLIICITIQCGANGTWQLILYNTHIVAQGFTVAPQLLLI